MSAVTVKIILKILLMLLEDEETRKKLVTTIAVGISIFLIVITFPMYLLTHPMEAFGTLIENPEQYNRAATFSFKKGGTDLSRSILSCNNVQLFRIYSKNYSPPQ